MSDWINPLNEASVALGARFEETWRVVWARDPLKSQVLAFVQAEIDAAVKVAREDAEANAKRAEKAEAERAALQDGLVTTNKVLECWNKKAEAAEADRDAALKRAEAAEAALAKMTGERDRCCDDYQREAARAEKAEAAEAEVARLKALLEAKQPYTPRVGDVVLFDGERRDSAEELPRIVTTVEPDGWWSCVHLNRRRDAVACGPFRISGRIGKARLHRPATPAERAAAGLPPEPCAKCGQLLPEPPGIGGEYRCDRCGVPTLHDSPAKPEVLREHLAWMEADAAWACSSWSTGFDALENKKRHDEAILAARALSAAVARRDGALNAAAAKEV